MKARDITRHFRLHADNRNPIWLIAGNSIESMCEKSVKRGSVVERDNTRRSDEESKRARDEDSKRPREEERLRSTTIHRHHRLRIASTTHREGQMPRNTDPDMWPYTCQAGVCRSDNSC